MHRTNAIRTAAELGALLRRVRVATGLPQRDAAHLCGVSERFLVQLEQGKPGARLDLVLDVCRGLGVVIEARAPVNVDVTEGPSALRRGPKPKRKRPRTP